MTEQDRIAKLESEVSILKSRVSELEAGEIRGAPAAKVYDPRTDELYIRAMQRRDSIAECVYRIS